MSVYIHKGTGGDTLVPMTRGGAVREARADSLRHLNPSCGVLALTMQNSGMARAANTAPLRARTDQCWHEGCWDSYGKDSERERRIGFAAGVKVAPEVRKSFRANVSAAKRAAKQSAKKKSA